MHDCSRVQPIDCRLTPLKLCIQIYMNTILYKYYNNNNINSNNLKIKAKF